MCGENAFQVEGLVTEALPNGTYRAELANGHKVLAFVVLIVKLKLDGMRVV